MKVISAIIISERKLKVLMFLTIEMIDDKN